MTGQARRVSQVVQIGHQTEPLDRHLLLNGVFSLLESTSVCICGLLQTPCQEEAAMPILENNQNKTIQLVRRLGPSGGEWCPRVAR